MSAALTWARVRVAGGVAVLAVLVWRLGTGPFLDGVRRSTPGPCSRGSCSGCRHASAAPGAGGWSLERSARHRDGAAAAAAAYYRSQFLNTMLPGGVLGDVHRGVRHGRAADDVPRSLRAVVWDRWPGRSCSWLAAVVLLALSSPVPGRPPGAGRGPGRRPHGRRPRRSP